MIITSTEYSSIDNWNAALDDLDFEHDYSEALVDQIQEQYTPEEREWLQIETEHAQSLYESLPFAKWIHRYEYCFCKGSGDLINFIKFIKDNEEWCWIWLEEFEHKEYKEIAGEWYDASHFVVVYHHEDRHMNVKVWVDDGYFILYLIIAPEELARLQAIFPPNNDDYKYELLKLLPVLENLDRRRFIDEILADL